MRDRNLIDQRKSTAGFTLIELIVVIVIVVVVAILLPMRTGAFSFWNEQAFIRKLTETISFLHYQSIADQAFYRLEFDFERATYRVGVMRVEEEIDESLSDIAQDAGNLSLELAAFLSPSTGAAQTMIPPPSFPSLSDPVTLPAGVEFEDVRTMRGKKTVSEGGKAAIHFSPRGFSEFAVIHLRIANEPVTILVNPFTGLTEVFYMYKDFEWTYGRSKADRGA